MNLLPDGYFFAFVMYDSSSFFITLRKRLFRILMKKVDERENQSVIELFTEVSHPLISAI